jgi:quercetin dioxygenase-like cupin family protein
MQRFRRFIALIFAVVLTSTPAAFAGPRNTAELKENGRAPAHESAKLAQQAGKDFTISAVSVRVGDSLPITDAIVLVKAGEVRAERNCTQPETWPAGHFYLSPGPALVTNVGHQVADVIVVSFNASRGDPAACGAASTARSVEMSRGVAESDATFDIEAGKQIVVQSYVVEPGFNFFWHQHPGPTMIVEQQGTMTEYFGCGATKPWEPGYVYHHHAGHHGQGKQTVKNEGEEAAVFMVVYFNVWEWHPAPLVPRDVEPPPAECPTASLV